MAEFRVLVTCRLVWDIEERLRTHLDQYRVAIDVPRYEGQQIDSDELLANIGAYDGLLAGDERITRPVLQRASRLKVVSKWGVGVDGIDLESADELGISIFNTPGVFGEEIADYAMGFIHMLARRQHEVNERVRSGEWHKVRGTSLKGRTLGIVGLGSSGKALVKRGLASSMHVVGFDVAEVGHVPGCEVVSFDDVLKRADVISLHIPATPASHHLLDSRAFAKVKKGVWLVNTSRGSLVDEVDLMGALLQGIVGGAALDVFEVEPVSPANPLLALDNVIVGSHNGSNTAEAIERTTWRAVDNLLKGLGLTETR